MSAINTDVKPGEQTSMWRLELKMTDEEYIAQKRRELEKDMKRFKALTAVLLLGIGICLCVLAAVAIVG